MSYRFGRTLVPALLFATSAALAQEPAKPSSAPAPGSETTERDAAEVQRDYWRGRGTGPGSMRGYGPGGGAGMGPGMMDPGMGRGMGPGMMGHGMMGHGMMGPDMTGPGMMGGGVGRALSLRDLDEAQRKQILQAGDELRRKHWELVGQMHEEMAKLRDASWPGKRDRAAIFAAHKRLSELRLQQIESSLDAADQVDKILKPEQRERLDRFGPWWANDETQ